MAATRAHDPGRMSFMLAGETISLRLDGFLIGAIESRREKDRTGRGLSEMIREALEDAFRSTGAALLAKIDLAAAEDRRGRADVIRIALQDAFQPDAHPKPIYPPKRRRT